AIVSALAEISLGAGSQRTPSTRGSERGNARPVRNATAVATLSAGSARQETASRGSLFSRPRPARRVAPRTESRAGPAPPQSLLRFLSFSLPPPPLLPT